MPNKIIYLGGSRNKDVQDNPRELGSEILNIYDPLTDENYNLNATAQVGEDRYCIYVKEGQDLNSAMVSAIVS